jgi:hypothetical protein
MRAAAPPVAFELMPSREWMAVVVSLGGLGLAAVVGSACAHLQAPPWFALLSSIFAAFVGGALLAWLVPQSRGRLHWDGGQWWYAPNTNANSELNGDLSVMIDLGDWMLLRFDPASSWRGRGRVWLPVNSRALGAAAHGLRLAAYGRRLSVSILSRQETDAE